MQPPAFVDLDFDLRAKDFPWLPPNDAEPALISQIIFGIQKKYLHPLLGPEARHIDAGPIKKRSDPKEKAEEAAAKSTRTAKSFSCLANQEFERSIPVLERERTLSSYASGAASTSLTYHFTHVSHTDFSQHFTLSEAPEFADELMRSSHPFPLDCADDLPWDPISYHFPLLPEAPRSTHRPIHLFIFAGRAQNALLPLNTPGVTPVLVVTAEEHKILQDGRYLPEKIELLVIHSLGSHGQAYDPKTISARRLAALIAAEQWGLDEYFIVDDNISGVYYEPTYATDFADLLRKLAHEAKAKNYVTCAIRTVSPLKENRKRSEACLWR